MKLSSLSTTTISETSLKAKFRKQLESLGKSQNQIADAIGVDKSTICRYLKSGEDRRQPSLDTLRSMAKQGIDVVDLFGLESPVEENEQDQSESDNSPTPLD